MKYILITVLFLLSVNAVAQEQSPIVKHKKISLKRGYSLFKEDSAVYALSDTILYLPIQQEYYIKKGNAEKDLFHKIKQTSSKNRFAREIANSIIKTSTKRLSIDTVNTKLSQTYFDNYQNLVIRNIKYKRLMPFGPTVYGTNIYAKLWYQKAGNSTHIRTAQWVIKNNILFTNGDVVNPRVFSDNERLLRQLPFIQDAKIVVSGISINGDSVDIDVITKDVWSKGVAVEIADMNSGNFKFWDNNVLGLGKVFENKILWNSTKDNKLGYDGWVRMDNINGSFINSAFEYIDNFGLQSYRAILGRNFFTPSIKWAGGANAEYISTLQIVNLSDTVLTPIEYKNAGCWMARSFNINKDNSSPTQTNIVLSGSINYFHFIQRPNTVNADGYFRFHNRVTSLGSIAFTKQGYYKSNLIYNFGRTEDIPFGYLIAFTGGVEKSEFNDRLYTLLTASRGGYYGRNGYLYGAAAIGSFWHSHHAEQTIFKTQLNYFSNLLEFGQYSVRHFVNINYTQGFNMFPDDYLLINTTQGIRGFRSNLVQGQTKMVLSIETTFFTPFYLFGFRFAMFGFTDAATIGKSTVFYKNPSYCGIGLGVRLKNERLVLPTIQIRIAYYPIVSDKMDPLALVFIGENRFNSKDFYVRQPEVLKFQ